MFCVPQNLKTALICEGQECSQMSFILFKVAYAFAEKGENICILSNSLKENEEAVLLNDKYLSHPEILQKITFRYMKSSKEVIQWCHQTHSLHKISSVLLIPLDQFCKGEEFESVSICAALVDVMINFCGKEQSKKFHLFATISIDFDLYLPYILTFFHFSWLVKTHFSSIYLIPYDGKDKHKSVSEFIVSDNLRFQDLQKIFMDYHDTKI